LSEDHAGQDHIGVDVYVLTWIALLILTAATVAVAGLRLGKLSVLTAIAIASVKTVIVLSFFMHLKYENRLLKSLVYVVIGVIALLIGLTFTDFLFR
jgi:cytochrome c oxidase subunit 4